MFEEWIPLKKRGMTVSTIFFGLIFTLIGYFTAWMIFPDSISVAHMLIVTLILSPFLVKLIDKEEVTERKEGFKHFYRNHSMIFDIYSSLFIGIFIGYMLIGVVLTAFPAQFSDSFGYQVDYLKENEQSTTDLMDAVLGEGGASGIMMSTLTKSLALIGILFILSVFYGSGGVFMIAATASVISCLVLFSFRFLAFSKAYSILMAVFFLVYLIPLAIAFLLTAISGGVVSKAIIREKFGSKEFFNVIKDGASLMLVSIVMVVLASVLQLAVTKVAAGFI